jgi:hypothetical protein
MSPDLMRQFTAAWLSAGALVNVAYLSCCYLMRTGKAGKQLQAGYLREHQPGDERVNLAVHVIWGFMLPPHALAGTACFCNRARRERDRRK